MSTPADIQKAADQLWQAAQQGRVCAPVRELIGSQDIEAAYQVQLINNKRRLEGGERLVGKKIGLTSKAVQQQLGVDQPDFGLLFDSMSITSSHTISWDKLMQPKVEAEVALIMGQDLHQCHDDEQLLQAVDHAVASIEIVGSRIQAWDIKITDTVADNASASHFVLGETKADPKQLDLVNCQMTLVKNGEEVSRGMGQNCLGSPIKAACWLAQTMIDHHQPLKQGDIILTGALGPMVQVEPGDKVTAEITGLGSVSLEFGNS